MPEPARREPAPEEQLGVRIVFDPDPELEAECLRRLAEILDELLAEDE